MVALSEFFVSYIVLFIHTFCMQVAKDAVSKFHVGRSASVPHCAFELHLLHGKSLQQQPLLHKVDLTGVTFPHDFYIRYPLPKSEQGTILYYTFSLLHACTCLILSLFIYQVTEWTVSKVSELFSEQNFFYMPKKSNRQTLGCCGILSSDCSNSIYIARQLLSLLW